MRKRSTYHHGDLRQTLVEAAFAQVDREGADSLSLAALAKSLGVSQAAPYRHFPDRTALLLAVATQGFREFTARLQQAAITDRKEQVLSRMGQAYVDFGTTRPGIYRLMFASPILREPAAAGELGVVARASFALLENALPPCEARTRQLKALRIWVALHGTVMLVNQQLIEGVGNANVLPDLVAAILAT